jgi:hypothetical protein
LFSTGSTACAAMPDVTASIASSKLKQGSGSASGTASTTAWCE